MNSNIFNCSYKLLHHPETMEQIRTTGDCFPLNVEFHPTMRCNHQCVKCATVVDKIATDTGFLAHTDSAGSSAYQWGEEEAVSLLREMAACGVKAITFGGGGEPLLHPSINLLMEVVNDTGMVFGVITNLDVDLSAIANISKAKWIRVSLDAATESTHNRIHRPNRMMGAVGFNRVMFNLRLLSELNLNVTQPTTVGINYLVYPENMGEMELAVKQYQQYADYIRFTPVHDAQEGKGYDCSVLAKLFEAATLARTLPHFKIIGAIDRFVNMANPRKTYRECYWQRVRPVIGADGFLYPCCVLNYYEKHRVLDLRAYPAFELAWNSAERKHKHSILNPHFCPPCWVDAENQMACYLADKEVPHVEFV